ncbi:MAG: protein TolR [Gammaproteobacteria bacterium RIFCSPHIGHO2_12_FULL_38_14]|nr:MAG: protein TolR [Gammaproteobacteria bacterium RIFCSPHIGHO2_12_FULL_38_14]
MAYLHDLKSRRRPMSEINVVPFIDVMLVLLVIFMVTAPLLTQGVKVKLPETTASALTDQKKEPLIVTVDAKGQFYLNLSDKPNQPITARTLTYLIGNVLSRQTTDERPILVRGDKDVNYGKVMEAMALLKKAGAKSVGLVTEPSTDQQT